MNKPLYDFFTADHERIEDILNRSVLIADKIDEELYRQFRVGLLTHIKMEERILFKAAREAKGGDPLPIAPQLKLEHGALTALMVLPPSAEVIKVIRHIMALHDIKEEEPGGMYDACELLTKERTNEILEELAQNTEVPVHPPNPKPIALKAAKNALARAGYDYDEIVRQSM